MSRTILLDFSHSSNTTWRSLSSRGRRFAPLKITCKTVQNMILKHYYPCPSTFWFNYGILFARTIRKRMEKKHKHRRRMQMCRVKKSEGIMRAKKSYIINYTYGIIVVHDLAIFFADRSWLQFTSGGLVIRFRCCWHVVDVMDTVVKHLHGERERERTKRRIKKCIWH